MNRDVGITSVLRRCVWTRTVTKARDVVRAVTKVNGMLGDRALSTLKAQAHQPVNEQENRACGGDEAGNSQRHFTA